MPAADLVLVQAAQALAGLEALLDGPAPPGDLDQNRQRGRARRAAAVEGQLAGGAVPADQQSVASGLVGWWRTIVVQARKRPVGQAVALGACSSRPTLPRPGRDPPERPLDPVGDATPADPVVAGDRQHIADLAGLQLGPQPGSAP